MANEVGIFMTSASHQPLTRQTRQTQHLNPQRKNQNQAFLHLRTNEEKSKSHTVKSTRFISNEHLILSMDFNNITLFGNERDAYFNKAEY